MGFVEMLCDQDEIHRGISSRLSGFNLPASHLSRTYQKYNMPSCALITRKIILIFGIIIHRVLNYSILFTLQSSQYFEEIVRPKTRT